MNRIWRISIRVVVLCMASGVALGCIGRKATDLPDMPLPATALAAVTALPPVALLAVGGTQQLSATGMSFAGQPVTTFDSVLYRYQTPADSVRARLSTTGLVTGLAASPLAILVNVLGFQGTAIRGDQVLIQVNATAIPGLLLSIQPVAPDSAKLAAGSAKMIVPVLRNPTTGDAISNPVMAYHTKGTDSTRMDVYKYPVFYNGYSGTDFIYVRGYTSNLGATNKVVALSGEGSVWLYATLSAFGTLLQDSVQYTLSYPYTATLSTVKSNLRLTNLFQNQVLTLAPGAIVTFQNGVSTTDPLTIAYTFDMPAAAAAAFPASTSGGASGNVTTLTGGQTSRRVFLALGTYHWTVTSAGGPAPWPGQTMSGTIVIK